MVVQELQYVSQVSISLHTAEENLCLRFEKSLLGRLLSLPLKGYIMDSTFKGKQLTRYYVSEGYYLSASGR